MLTHPKKRSPSEARHYAWPGSVFNCKNSVKTSRFYLRRARLRTFALLLCLACMPGLITACAKKTVSTTGSEASAAVSAGPAGTLAASGDPGRGKTIFTNNCSTCHGATGTEGGVGPSLKNEKSRKDFAATAAWIKNPQPPMPKLFPGTLNEKEVADVAAFIQTL